MTDLVERLVPDELWVLFRRVVTAKEVKRPQGGGRRRAGDREALAAIVFVATSGCTWRQLPPVFGPYWQRVYRRFAQWSRDRVRCAIDSVRVRIDHRPARGTHSHQHDHGSNHLNRRNNLNAETTLRDLEELFTTSPRTMVPTAESRHRKPSGEGDQRTCED